VLRTSDEVDFTKVKDSMFEQKISNVTLDYDVRYDDFQNNERYRLLKKFYNEYPAVFDISIRRSGGGHVHIKIDFYSPITLMEHFCIRAALLDDRVRMIKDMNRVLMGTEINVLFDKKYVRGKVHYATEWTVFR